MFANVQTLLIVFLLLKNLFSMIIHIVLIKIQLHPPWSCEYRLETLPVFHIFACHSRMKTIYAI